MAATRSLAALEEDYRLFLARLIASDSAHVLESIGDDDEQARWLREIAEPWWAAVRTLAREDGLELYTYEGHPACDVMFFYQHTACAKLAAPDGTRYPDNHWYATATDRPPGGPPPRSDGWYAPEIIAAAERDYGTLLHDARERRGVVSELM